MIFHNFQRTISKIACIWCKDMLENLSLDMLCSTKLTVLLELCSWELFTSWDRYCWQTNISAYFRHENICFQVKWRLLFSSFTFSMVQSVKSSLTVCLLHNTYLYQFHSHVPLVFSCVQYLFGISVLPLAALVFSWPTPPLLSVLHYLVAPFFFPQEL